MTLDVVICTYNRPATVYKLVKQLQQCLPLPDRIIVMDSSDEENKELRYEGLVYYIRSNHKNQPYQRFCGWHFSDADILLYLDDDMEVVRMNFVEMVKLHFSAHSEDVAMALHFEDKSNVSSLSEIPQSKLLKKGSVVKKYWNKLSGQPEYAVGKLGWCGMRGKQPLQGGYTEWLSGGAFAARRKMLFQNFNFQIFDLFESKRGMGEDAMIGYTLSKLGGVYYFPDLLFYHVDEGKSHYAANPKTYAERVMYSRLFLSLEKARLDGISSVGATAHYLWYGFCRLMGYLLNAMLHLNRKRFQILSGSVNGYFAGWGLRQLPIEVREQYWLDELKKINA